MNILPWSKNKEICPKWVVKESHIFFWDGVMTTRKLRYSNWPIEQYYWFTYGYVTTFTLDCGEGSYWGWLCTRFPSKSPCVYGVYIGRAQSSEISGKIYYKVWWMSKTGQGSYASPGLHLDEFWVWLADTSDPDFFSTTFHILPQATNLP